MTRGVVAEEAYARLRTAIATGRMPPGMVLSESSVSADLGISRTPVRRALRRLALEGHVERDRRGRAVVRSVSQAELSDIFAVRSMLERFGARQAATRISDDELERLASILAEDRVALRRRDVGELARLNQAFHGLIMRASRNRTLVELFDALQWRILGLSVFAVGDREDGERFVAEHAEMLGLLVDGDADGIDALVEHHLASAGRILGSMPGGDASRSTPHATRAARVPGPSPQPQTRDREEAIRP